MPKFKDGDIVITIDQREPIPLGTIGKIHADGSDCPGIECVTYSHPELNSFWGDRENNCCYICEYKLQLFKDYEKKQSKRPKCLAEIL